MHPSHAGPRVGNPISFPPTPTPRAGAGTRTMEGGQVRAGAAVLVRKRGEGFTQQGESRRKHPLGAEQCFCSRTSFVWQLELADP